MIARPPLQTRTTVAFTDAARKRLRLLRTGRPRATAGTLALVWAFAAHCAGAASLELSLADVTGPGFAARDVTVALTPADDAFAGVLRIGALELPPPTGTQGPVALQCGTLRVHRNGVSCGDGRLQGPWPEIDTSNARLSLELVTDGHVRAELTGVGVAGGQVSLTLNRRGNGALRAELRLRDLDVEQTPRAWLALLPLPDGFAVTGRLDGNVVARVGADGAVDVRATTMPQHVGFSDADGSLAAEHIGMTVDAHLHGRLDARIEFRGLVRMVRGQAYFEPVFLDFDDGPVQFEIAGHREGPDAEPVLTRLRYRDPEVLAVDGRGALTADGAGHFDVERIDAGLEGAYARYAQPFLLGTPLDTLTPRGTLQASVRWRDGGIDSLTAYLRDASITDRQERLDFDGLGAEVHWSRAGEARRSWIEWSGGGLLRMALGPSRLEFRAAGDQVSAPGRQRIPVLDGAMVIGELALTGLADGAPRLRVEAELEPISLRRLTAALEWPEMRGTLAGSLPGIAYHDRTLTTDGTLRARVFDGDITVDNLRIEGLLSPLPRLEADVTMRQLDLETLTGTFAFGQISGRVDGELLGLRLVNWQPSAFRARLYTTPGYTGRRRISQRAIDNLSSIGTGGMGGALSGGFMRFFDEFNYAEIGLSCTLRNEVCHMGGAGAANGGYYLVRGRGLPRIDVIGSADRVAWPLLLQQLASLQQLDEAVIR